MRCTFKDKLAVNKVLAHDEVFPTASEDGCTAVDRYHMADIYLASDHCVVLLPKPGIVLIAFPRYKVQYEIHVSMMKEHRGKAGVKAAKEGIEYMWQNTSARKLVGFIPAYNTAAVKFARMMGFKKEGVLTKSYRKDGKMHDMIIVGIQKGR